MRGRFWLCGILVLSLAIKSRAQVQPAWTARYDGGAAMGDSATAVKLDSVGNAYVLGQLSVEGGGGDLAIVKYDPSGNQVWAARYTLSGTFDVGAGLAVDAIGNIYAA